VFIPLACVSSFLESVKANQYRKVEESVALHELRT
jgi:hypothetical protein